MTYFYDNCVEKYGKATGRKWLEGIYITPDGKLFDVDGMASVAHAGGFVIPFFRHYMHPDRRDIQFYNKKELLKNLINWKKLLLTKKYDVNPKEQQMRFYLVCYLINVYRSNNAIYNRNDGFVDFSKVTGIPNIEENWIGRDVTLKSILVQACGYDSIESQVYRTITTSKHNIYEIFYDYILHDYKVVQIPKKVYDENLQQYVDWYQSEWFLSDKELRLKDELKAICNKVPLEERDQYCRSKIKVNRYNFVN